MKVLQVTAIDFTAQKFLLPLVDTLQNKGYTTHIACCVSDESQAMLQAYQVHHIPFSRSLQITAHVKSIAALYQLLRQERYDVVHAHTPIASLIARFAAKLAGVPTIIYTAHGFYFHDNMPKWQYAVAYHLEKVFARLFTDEIFFQSIEDYTLAVEKRFKAPQYLTHISNGVDRNKFNPAHYKHFIIRDQLGIDQQAPVFIFVGRLVKEKGVEELIQAFEQLPQQEAYLLIVGDTVNGDRSLANLTTHHPRILFLGLRHDIPALLHAADIFVLPSYREGLPRSIIEAMAMGKAIIATNIRGCREEVSHAVNGLLCEPADVDSLKECMAYLLSTPILIQQYGAKSRAIFLNQFDEAIVLQKQVDVYHTLQTTSERVTPSV